MHKKYTAFLHYQIYNIVRDYLNIIINKKIILYIYYIII